MLGHLTRYIILLIIFTLSLPIGAQKAVDSLRNRFVEADNLSDSIRLLYTIYGNSNCYAPDDSMLQVLISRVEKLPESPEKQSALVYMNVMATSNQVKSLAREEREDKLRDYLARHTKSEEFDIYQRIEYLFKLCTYLRMSTEGEMLTNYFQELQLLIDSLPENDLALKYLFYSQAANTYLTNGMVTEAVDANKKMLNIIEEFQKQDAMKSSALFDYDIPSFTCYNRLLLCHDKLSKEEVDEYYGRIVSLFDNNPDLKKLSGERKIADISYLMAKKRYSDAVPVIKEQLNDSGNTREERMYLVNSLLEASESIGDKADLLMALEMSNKMLKDRIKKKADESYKELQMIYEVNDLKEANEELLLANQQIVINRHKERLTYGIICIVVLVILLVFVFVLYRRSKRLTSNLAKSNSMVIEERDALQHAQEELLEARKKAKVANRIRTDFINNMGHEIKTPLESIVEYSGLIADCADPDRREYIKRFADIITLNTDLLLTLVNDVLDLPSLENAKFSTHIMKSSLHNICNVAIDNVRHHIKPGIELVFANKEQPDTTIMADPQRVEQVLLNLLMNAAKFTDKGSIVLEYKIPPEHDKVVFTVTDTGIGIPLGKEDVIFSRSAQLNSTTQGTGLGLYISRLLANMLGGSLKLDTDYRTGAKFIFTIPIS